MLHENHEVSIFGAPRQWVSLKIVRITPAMEAGLTDHVWSVEELVNLLPQPQPAKRGPNKKKLAA